MPESESSRQAQPEAPDERNELHDTFISIVLDGIERDRYPSAGTLDLLQAVMTDDDRRQIAALLLDKVAAQRYPSPAMLRRLGPLVG
ncbi:MAG TPA: hypothetical protein VJ851_01485 [Jatrophihabitans sp.]|nr:hypothetical protein [Jatrophihabitans sp.]